jgi:hypothetical protein
MAFQNPIELCNPFLYLCMRLPSRSGSYPLVSLAGANRGRHRCCTVIVLPTTTSQVRVSKHVTRVLYLVHFLYFDRIDFLKSVVNVACSPQIPELRMTNGVVSDLCEKLYPLHTKVGSRPSSRPSQVGQTYCRSDVHI